MDQLHQDMPDNPAKSQLPASVNTETIADLETALMESGYPEERIKQLNQIVNSPDNGLLLQTLKDLADAGTGWKDLSALIDESCYSVSDWAKAIVCFLKWERHCGLYLDPNSMLSYLSCSAEAAASSPILQPFEEQVEEMLETFGYAGSD